MNTKETEEIIPKSEIIGIASNILETANNIIQNITHEYYTRSELEELLMNTTQYGDGSFYYPKGSDKLHFAFYYDDSQGIKKRKVMSGSNRIEIINKHSAFFGNEQRTILDNMITYGEVLDEYISFYKAKNRADITQDKVLGILKNHTRPYFGDMQISEIKALDIQNFLNSLTILPDGGKRSTNSLRKIYTYTKSTLEYAYENNYIAKMPTYSVELPKGTTTPKDSKVFEYNELIEHLSDTYTNKKYYIISLMLLATGLRPQEFLALRWSNIDYKNKVISITNAINQVYKDSDNPDAGFTFKEGTTKNENSVRKIFLTDTMVSLLKQWKKLMKDDGYIVQAKKLKTDDFIILSKTGTFYRMPTLIRNYNKHIANNGKYKHKCNFYKFRHSFATFANEQRIQDTVISELMGHSCGDKSITKQVYISNTKSLIHESSKLYNDFLEKVIADVEKNINKSSKK